MSDLLPTLRAQVGKVPARVLTVGDPKRVDRVAERLGKVEPISENREYRLVKGVWQGKEIGVVSHGVGSAGAGLCFEELCRGGAKTIIRAGSAGGMQPEVVAGDLVIATAAVREDGLSPKLVPLAYPAFVPAEVLLALRASAAALGHPCREGVALTLDMFYPHRALGSDLPLWQRAGVAAVEMECATLLVIASLHGLAAGAVLAIDGNPLAQDEGSMATYNPHKAPVRAAVEKSIDIALGALAAL